ncbi:MAG: DUF1048 domain-containing protein [Rhodoglobus sp.]
MAAQWIELLTGSFEDKRRWRRYKTRKEQLAPTYRMAMDGIERYLMTAGTISDGGVLMNMFEDLADLIEGTASDGTPIREIVGDDPAEFADTFIQNYSDGQWNNKERNRLNATVDKAAKTEHVPGKENRE